MKTQPNSAVTETLLLHEQTKNHQRASEPTFATRISIMISTKAFVEPHSGEQLPNSKRLYLPAIIGGFKVTPEDIRVLPGEFYFEAGQMVFTAQYHRRRGYCCGNNCRHCPYPKPMLVSNA